MATILPPNEFLDVWANLFWEVVKVPDCVTPLDASDTMSHEIMARLESDHSPVPQDVLELTEFEKTCELLPLFGATMTPHATVFLIGMARRTPQVMKMYVAAFAARQRVNKMDIITVPSIVEALPLGFPTERSLAGLWLAQKLHQQPGQPNILDRVDFTA